MKKDISIIVTKSVVLDKIELRKRAHVAFGTKTWLLFQSFAQSVQS